MTASFPNGSSRWPPRSPRSASPGRSGSSSASSTASGCSRSSRGRTSGCSRATACRSTFPSVAGAIAQLPVDDVILDGEITWDRHGALSRVRRRVARRARRQVAAARGTPRAARAAAASSRRSQRVAALDDPNPWERACREGWEGVIAKRRDSRLRAPPLAALAEDEVRGLAGVRRRRIHRSAGRARRPGRAARRLLTSEARFRLCRKDRHRASTRSCCSTCARGSTRSKSPTSPFTKAIGLPRLRAHWVRPEIVVQVAFIEWTVHGKLRHPRLLGVRYDKNPRDVVTGDSS